jgi:hypothetical protein
MDIGAKHRANAAQAPLIALSRRMIRLARPLCFPNTEYIQYMPVRDSDTNNNFHHYQDSDFDTLQFSNTDKDGLVIGCHGVDVLRPESFGA